MAEVKWIKLNTDIFSNRKIIYLRTLPEGENIVLFWIMLLTLAGRCNAGGCIYFMENVPYTTKMLSNELSLEENTVHLALKSLSDMRMIETLDNGYIFIPGWEEYQNIDRLAEIREYNRIAKQKSREKQKLLADVNDKSKTSQRGHDTDIDKDIDKEIRNKSKSKKESIEEIEVMLSAFPEVDDAIKAFIEFRKKAKKPMTDKAVQLLVSKLESMSADPRVQVEILNQSMINGWTGIYDLKAEGKKSNMDVLTEWRNAYD